VPDPERFGVVVYGDGNVARHRREGGRRRQALRLAALDDAVVGLYCYPPDVFEIIDTLQPSSRGELEITDVNREYARRGELVVQRVDGWWPTAASTGAISPTSAASSRRRASTSDQAVPAPAARGRPRGWFQELVRAGRPAEADPQANLAHSRKGVIRALHYHERGQDDLFVCLQGMVRVVVLDRETARPSRGHRRRQPRRDLRRGRERARLRGADGRLFCYLRHRGVRPPANPDEHGRRVERPAGRRPLEHSRSPILSDRGQGRPRSIPGAGGQLGRAHR
jgi:hypothetical protein